MDDAVMRAPTPVITPRPPLFPENNPVAATIFAEAMGEPREGMQAVFDVIRNRANKQSRPWMDIVKQQSQFNGYGNDNFQRAMNNGLNAQQMELFNTIRKIMEEDGPDTTGGAMNFLNPVQQIKNTGGLPTWANPEKLTRQIGNHNFYR